MIPETSRPLSTAEQAVLHAILEKGAQTPLAKKCLSTLDALRVVAHCECGCGSIDFATNNCVTEVANGVGNLQSGELIEIIVWGEGDQLSGLAFAGGPGGFALPVPSTVRSWKDEKSRR